MLTGFPEEDPDAALVRVVTGPADPAGDPRRAALVRVVTGALPGVPVPACEPLARVLMVPAGVAEPAA